MHAVRGRLQEQLDGLVLSHRCGRVLVLPRRVRLAALFVPQRDSCHCLQLLSAAILVPVPGAGKPGHHRTRRAVFAKPDLLQHERLWRTGLLLPLPAGPVHADWIVPAASGVLHAAVRSGVLLHWRHILQRVHGGIGWRQHLAHGRLPVTNEQVQFSSSWPRRSSSKDAWRWR